MLKFSSTHTIELRHRGLVLFPGVRLWSTMMEMEVEGVRSTCVVTVLRLNGVLRHMARVDGVFGV